MLCRRSSYVSPVQQYLTSLFTPKVEEVRQLSPVELKHVARRNSVAAIERELSLLNAGKEKDKDRSSHRRFSSTLTVDVDQLGSGSSSGSSPQGTATHAAPILPDRCTSASPPPEGISVAIPALSIKSPKPSAPIRISEGEMLKVLNQAKSQREAFEDRQLHNYRYAEEFRHFAAVQDFQDQVNGDQYGPIRMIVRPLSARLVCQPSPPRTRTAMPKIVIPSFQDNVYRGNISETSPLEDGSPSSSPSPGTGAGASGDSGKKAVKVASPPGLASPNKMGMGMGMGQVAAVSPTQMHFKPPSRRATSAMGSPVRGPLLSARSPSSSHPQSSRVGPPSRPSSAQVRRSSQIHMPAVDERERDRDRDRQSEGAESLALIGVAAPQAPIPGR
jgi:hypothetical protein